MVIHHGTDDQIAPIDQTRRFRDAMVRSGNVCALIEYERAEHGFHYPDNSAHFDHVMDTSTRFLLAAVTSG